MNAIIWRLNLESPRADQTTHISVHSRWKTVEQVRLGKDSTRSNGAKHELNRGIDNRNRKL
jgi:hypothetical protein